MAIFERFTTFFNGPPKKNKDKENNVPIKARTLKEVGRPDSDEDIIKEINVIGDKGFRRPRA